MRVLDGSSRRLLGTAGTPFVDLLLAGVMLLGVVQLARVAIARLAPGSGAAVVEAADAAPPAVIVLTMRADGAFLVNGAGLDARGLPARLAALYRDRPVKLLFLEAPANLPFGQVQATVRVAYRAGVETIGYLPALDP